MGGAVRDVVIVLWGGGDKEGPARYQRIRCEVCCIYLLDVRQPKQGIPSLPYFLLSLSGANQSARHSCYQQAAAAANRLDTTAFTSPSLLPTRTVQPIAS